MKEKLNFTQLQLFKFFGQGYDNKNNISNSTGRIKKNTDYP